MIKKNNGFIKLNRGVVFMDDLLEHPFEWTLLSVIAYRSSRNGNPIKGLCIGEALIGDYESYGMTRQNYRTAIKNLIKWDLATFKPTNKGTIARLTNSSIYDINIQQPNQQLNQSLTKAQPKPNHYQEYKEDKEKKRKKDIYRKFAHLQISTTNADKLIAEYSKVELDDILDDIENYAKNKTYKDLYLTARKWLKKNVSQQPTIDLPEVMIAYGKRFDMLEKIQKTWHTLDEEQKKITLGHATAKMESA